jgi:hypothetical protein
MWYLPFPVLAVKDWPTLGRGAGACPDWCSETIDDRTGAGKRAPEGRP